MTASRALRLAALALALLAAGCQTAAPRRGEFPIPNYPNPDGET